VLWVTQYQATLLLHRNVKKIYIYKKALQTALQAIQIVPIAHTEGKICHPEGTDYYSEGRKYHPEGKKYHPEGKKYHPEGTLYPSGGQNLLFGGHVVPLRKAKFTIRKAHRCYIKGKITPSSESRCPRLRDFPDCKYICKNNFNFKQTTTLQKGGSI
jgi:hypothetical protein